jgi:mRNA-degrading endonuclease toxin of MazEF toxin-antitoxin module
MPIPTPEPGLVISYAYLWHHEREAGRQEGRKDRPSVIVLAIERPRNDTTVVVVLPITHAPPADPAGAVEIPAAVKRSSVNNFQAVERESIFGVRASLRLQGFGV